MKVKNLFNKLLKLIFPDNYSCNSCGEEICEDNEYGICDKCKSELKTIDGNICEICGLPLSSMATVCLRCKNKSNTYVMARTPFVYAGKIAGMIKRLKYKNGKYVAKSLSRYLADEYNKHKFNCDFIIPVPLHEKRQKSRGYNQAELLANQLSEIINIPVNSGCLVRLINTPTQTKLNYAQRQKNLDSAFKVQDKSAIKDKNILLVDDVFTTGATVESCTKKLLQAKAKNVYVLCVAHTVIVENNDKNNE